MATLSQAARKLLEDAGCREYDDDYLVIGNNDVMILLSHRAVSELNRQARYRAEQQKGAGK
jgi:hypothetical protein